MAWLDAVDFILRADEAREKKLGPANPRDRLLLMAPDAPRNETEYERPCEKCGCPIPKGRALCESCFPAHRQRELAQVRANGGRCFDCGADITERSASARRCEICSEVHHVKRQTRSHKRLKLEKPREQRFCVDCGEDITERHGQAKLCEPCGQERQRAAMRDYARRRRAGGNGDE